MSEGVKEKFKQIYQVLKSEILQNGAAFEFDLASRQRAEQMLDYTVPGGKLNRGIAVLETLALLKELDDPTQLDEQDFYKASIIGWCIQLLVGCALVYDDIVDDSHTRRGRACWFRLPNVGMVAINDCIFLSSMANMVLKKHFRNETYYVELHHLFSEIGIQTAAGQMIDLISPQEAATDITIFTLQLYRRICKFKTAYGTFYLPFASALLMLGKELDDHIEEKEILLEIGIYFQVQDDYLDCYGDPEKIGKIGTDIQDFKCSWLVVKALELCNEEQKKLLCDNYGKADPEKIDIVKSLYNDLDLEGVFADYEFEVYENLRNRIEALPSKAMQAVLNGQLSKIQARKK